MKMLSVRPCPSCGDFKRVKLCRIHFAVKRYEINCLRCGYCGKTAFTKRGAVEKWNNDKERAKLKTPEEIKKGLEICMAYNNCRDCPYRNGKCGMQLERDALAYIQQLEQRLVEVNKTSPRWISFKEREPRRLQRALVYSPAGNRIASGVYTEVGFITQTVIGEITHWMEIPEPPKEENENVT